MCFVFSDEDYESAVRALSGKLYLDPPEKKSAACGGDGMYVTQMLYFPILFSFVPNACWFHSFSRLSWVNNDLFDRVAIKYVDLIKSNANFCQSFCISEPVCTVFRVRLSGCVGEEADARGGGEGQKPPASAHLLLRPEHHRQRPGSRQARRLWDRSPQGTARPGESHKT